MSIGTVIADADTFRPLVAKYHVLPQECAVGGMFSDTLFLKTPVKPILCTRHEATGDLSGWLSRYGVTSLFAYNAGFDRNHHPTFQKQFSVPIDDKKHEGVNHNENSRN